MSCETNTNTIARLGSKISASISQLSSKEAFFAGLAIGTSGTGLGALVVANRGRIANSFRRLSGKNGGQPARQAVPIAGGSRQSTAFDPKPKSIPGLSGLPKSKQQSKPIPGLATKRATPRPIPNLSGGTGPALQTKLQAGPVQIQAGSGTYTPSSSYRVLRPDGSDTGLAVTPHIEEQGGAGQVVEQTGAWGVTHSGTGGLIDGPYESVSQAQGLATELSSLRWTGSTMSKQDVGRAKELIAQYRHSLSGKGD